MELQTGFSSVSKTYGTAAPVLNVFTNASDPILNVVYYLKFIPRKEDQTLYCRMQPGLSSHS